MGGGGAGVGWGWVRSGGFDWWWGCRGGVGVGQVRWFWLIMVYHYQSKPPDLIHPHPTPAPPPPRVYQSKAADALVQVKTTKFGTNVGLNMLLNISSRYFGGLFWSRQLRGLPSSDGYFWNAPPDHSLGLNQCWLIVDWTLSMLRNEIPWNSNQNKGIFIPENAFENAVC